MRRFLAGLFLLAGCRHQPPSYQLVRQGRTLILNPPPAPQIIKNAGANPSGQKCDINTGSIRLTWRGKSARFAVDAESYFDESSSQPRLYVNSLNKLQTFRDALTELSERGCLRKEGTSEIERAISEQVPMPPLIAYFFRFGPYSPDGYVELVPEFRLKVVGPAHDGSASTAFYVINPTASARVQIKLASGDANGFVIPESPAYYRYLFWTSKSAADYHATILSAPERAILRDATKKFQADPENTCGPALGNQVTCLSVPTNFAVNPEITVRVNGADAFVHLGGTVRNAIPGGRSAAATQTIEVRRMYKGKLIPVRFNAANDILDLVLMPGDEISVGAAQHSSQQSSQQPATH